MSLPRLIISGCCSFGVLHLITISFSNQKLALCICSSVSGALFRFFLSEILANFTSYQLSLFRLIIVAKFAVIMFGVPPMCISNVDSLVPGCGVNLSVFISSAMSHASLCGVFLNQFLLPLIVFSVFG